MQDLTGKDFKVAIINIFTKVTETTAEQVKEGKITMSHQEKNSNTKEKLWS
jgi:hypothetical protein